MTIACPCGRSYHADVDALTVIVRCPACGTGATVPPPTRDVRGDGLFDDAAAGYGGDRLAMREQWFREASLRLDWMRATMSHDARVLEIGAATGEFVATAQRAGHVVTGLETSPGAARAAQAVTSAVRNLDLPGWRADVADERVDAIAMFHVLEHADDPRGLLRELYEVLEPGGALYLEVPNGGSFLARRDGVDWWAARTEDHVFHFTDQGLRAALVAVGFEVEQLVAVHRDVYADRRTRLRVAAKDAIRPLVGKGRRSNDLLRVVARRPASRG